MTDLRLTADADAFFHESIERLAGAVGATFEGVSRDWIAGTDPIAGPPAGPQILTADGWKPLNPIGPAYSSCRAALKQRPAAPGAIAPSPIREA